MESVGNTATGLVLWCTGNQARLSVDGAEFSLSVPGKWRLKAAGLKCIAPGDRVTLAREDGGFRMIEVCTRENEFTRRASGPKPIAQTIAANIDFALIVASAAEPATPTGLVDRLLVTAAVGGIDAALVVNKIDLASKTVATFWRETYRFAVENIYFTSALTGAGISALAEATAGRTVMLAGSSGVGKSSIANRINPALEIKTGEVSEATGKGRHVTCSAEMHAAQDGGWLMDTPGLRECAPWGITPQNLPSAFREISRMAASCKFRDCRHRSETGCAVITAAGTPELPASRYQSYLKLLP